MVLTLSTTLQEFCFFWLACICVFCYEFEWASALDEHGVSSIEWFGLDSAVLTPCVSHVRASKQSCAVSFKKSRLLKWQILTMVRKFYRLFFTIPLTKIDSKVWFGSPPLSYVFSLKVTLTSWDCGQLFHSMFPHSVYDVGYSIWQ